MRAVVQSVLAATFLAGSTLAGSASAAAHDRGGIAVIAGLAGLGIGAAIASDHHDRYDRGYNYGYGYDAEPVYRAAPPAYGYGYDDRYGRVRYEDRGAERRDWHDRDGWRDRDYYRR